MHQLVDGLIRGLNDVYQAFVRLDHEILAAISVDKRTPGNIVVRVIGRKGHGTHDLSTRPHGGVQYLLTAVVYNPTVIRF